MTTTQPRMERDQVIQYTLHFDHLDGDTGIGPRDVEGDTAADLAQAVHRHARGYLGTARVDVHLDEETLTGDIVSHGILAGQFRLAVKEPEPAAPARLLHGYTAHGIDGLVRKVMAASRWRSGDRDERLAVVRCAIVERLCLPEEPSRTELFGIGLSASDQHVRDELRHHGWDLRNLDNGSAARAAFQAYWQAATAPSPERRVVDRQALVQIWPQLTPRERDALQALADTGDRLLAAAAMGVTEKGFNAMVNRARHRFLAWWHEGEAPSTFWHATRAPARCTDSTRSRCLTVSQVQALRDRHEEGDETIRAIAADIGIGASTLQRYLCGDTVPAPDPVGVAA